MNKKLEILDIQDPCDQVLRRVFDDQRPPWDAEARGAAFFGWA
jgi:hypothetical protein